MSRSLNDIVDTTQKNYNGTSYTNMKESLTSPLSSLTRLIYNSLSQLSSDESAGSLR